MTRKFRTIHTRKIKGGRIFPWELRPNRDKIKVLEAKVSTLEAKVIKLDKIIRSILKEKQWPLYSSRQKFDGTSVANTIVVESDNRNIGDTLNGQGHQGRHGDILDTHVIPKNTAVIPSSRFNEMGGTYWTDTSK